MRLWHRLRKGHWYWPIDVYLRIPEGPGGIVPVSVECRLCLWAAIRRDIEDEQRRVGGPPW